MVEERTGRQPKKLRSLGDHTHEGEGQPQAEISRDKAEAALPRQALHACVPLKAPPCIAHQSLPSASLSFFIFFFSFFSCRVGK